MIGGGLIMVLKMAIVDDDTLFLQDIEKISYEFLKKEKVIASIDTFFPYTTLFRSGVGQEHSQGNARVDCPLVVQHRVSHVRGHSRQ